MARDRVILVNMTAGLKPSPGADVAGMSSIPAQMWQGRAHSVPVQMWAGVSPITRVTTRVGPEALSLDRRVVNEDVLRAAVGPYKAVSCSYRYKAYPVRTARKPYPVRTAIKQHSRNGNAYTRITGHVATTKNVGA